MGELLLLLQLQLPKLSVIVVLGLLLPPGGGCCLNVERASETEREREREREGEQFLQLQCFR